MTSKQQRKVIGQLFADQLTVNGSSVTAALDGLTATATELNILDGATATTAELNLLDNQAASASFVVGVEATNAITVNVQILDAAGVDMATAVALQWYLADDSAGLDRSGTAPNTSVLAGTDGSLHISTTGLAGGLTTEADGDFDIVLTETGIATWYLVIVMPNGSLVVSPAITFA
jgi:hypothetical protein